MQNSLWQIEYGNEVITMFGYRTESFSGLGERNAAEVMAYETFEMNNADILETLRDTLLKDRPLSGKINAFLEELNREGFVDDISFDDGIVFFQEVLNDIQETTGKEIRYALWLTDLEQVLDYYGKYVYSQDDIDCYEMSDIVLSELSDGNLYGYTSYPFPLDLDNHPEQKAYIEETFQQKRVAEPEFLQDIKDRIFQLPDFSYPDISKESLLQNFELIKQIAGRYQNLVQNFYEEKDSAFYFVMSDLLTIDVLRLKQTASLNNKIEQAKSQKQEIFSKDSVSLKTKEEIL